METKEKTIEELQKERDELLETVYKLGREIEKKKLEGIDYTGKFIQYNGYKNGMMYVTCQVCDGDRNNGEITLQGFSMDVGITPHRDDFWIDGCAMQNWYIPTNIFEMDVKGNNIKEVDKETFLKYCRNGARMFGDFCEQILDNCIKEVEERKNEE